MVYFDYGSVIGLYHSLVSYNYNYLDRNFEKSRQLLLFFRSLIEVTEKKKKY